MGSEAGYSLKATGAPRAVVGRGSIHMEANYGESFPTGWVWAQVCVADMKRKLTYCRSECDESESCLSGLLFTAYVLSPVF